MKPTPPSPLFHGSTAASAKPVATAASTALPPAASTRAPASPATRFWVATMPPRERASGLRTCQFWTGVFGHDGEGAEADDIIRLNHNGKGVMVIVTA